MRYVRPRAPSKKAVRNTVKCLNALYGAESFDPLTLEPDRERKKTGPQEEGKTNKVIAELLKFHPELIMGRNKRRLATPTGMTQPIMLGWLIDGSSDWIGYRKLRVTQDMVGTDIAQAVFWESKRLSGGRLQPNQEAFLNRAKDDGAVAAVVRDAEDAERSLREWRPRK